MGSSIEALKEQRELIIEVAHKHGASNIRLFGSIVRNEDLPESDIDLLVEFDAARSLFDLIALKLELEEMLGKKVDVVTERALHPAIAENVKNEAISL